MLSPESAPSSRFREKGGSMILSDAIFTRTSQRAFSPRPLSPAHRQQLNKAVGQCNRRAGLSVRLICDRSEPFSGFSRGTGGIKGVRDYLLFTGPAEDPDLEEKCGYYGEEIILTAQAMGLASCWVGGTYDRKRCLPLLEQGEALVCAAAVGYPAGPVQGPRPHRSPQELASGLENAPDWFLAGIRAVRYAPSAMNRQGYRFALQPDGAASVRLSGADSFALVDLGIAKRHFELGAHGGEWTWGDGGVFRKAREEKSCGAVIWRSEDGRRQYLLARHNGGHWSFPKGHVEGTETEEETAIREIREETGLNAGIDTAFRHQVTYSPKPGVIKDVIFFIASPTGGEERPQEAEISQLGWFSFQEAAERITYATDEEILLAAEAYLNQ